MFRRIPRLAAASASLVATVALGAQPAQAAPAPPIETQAVTCYGGAVLKAFAMGGWGADLGPFTTSTRCADINLRNASVFPIDACVIFINVTDKCNYWTYLPANSDWRVIATRVRDNVPFKIRVETGSYQYDPMRIYTAY